MSINVDGVEPPPGREAHMVDRATVGPGFFDATGVKILRGRNFNERDLPYAPQAAIINQALADKFFVGRDALGGVLRRPDSENLFVVGIASNAKIRSLGEAPRDFVYRPYQSSLYRLHDRGREDAQRSPEDSARPHGGGARARFGADDLGK